MISNTIFLNPLWHTYHTPLSLIHWITPLWFGLTQILQGLGYVKYTSAFRRWNGLIIVFDLIDLIFYDFVFLNLICLGIAISSTYDSALLSIVDNDKYLKATDFSTLVCMNDQIISSITQCPASITPASLIAPSKSLNYLVSIFTKSFRQSLNKNILYWTFWLLGCFCRLPARYCFYHGKNRIFFSRKLRFPEKFLRQYCTTVACIYEYYTDWCGYVQHTCKHNNRP